MSSLRTFFLLAGILTAIPALLAFAAGALGLAGILADVGPDENRTLGIQALIFSVPFTLISTLLFTCFLSKRFANPSSEPHESDSRPS